MWLRVLGMWLGHVAACVGHVAACVGHVAACVGHVAADVGLQQQHSSDIQSCNRTAVQASSQHGNEPKFSDRLRWTLTMSYYPALETTCRALNSTTSIAHLRQISIPMRPLSC